MIGSMPRYSPGLVVLVVLLATAHAFAEPSLDDKMNAVLKARKLAPKAVVKRIATATAAWAVVATKRDRTRAATEYLVLRVRAGGTAALRLAPPATRQRWFDSVLSFEARDVDGDGSEEAFLVVRWGRGLTQKLPKTCRGCTQATKEQADQLYILGGNGVKLTIGFTHLLAYKTGSELLPRSRHLPRPNDEEVLYGWTIAGPPPVVRVQRYKIQVAEAPRIKGLLDPVKDPLLGDSRDVLIVFK